jgi:hypothetical protein
MRNVLFALAAASVILLCLSLWQRASDKSPLYGINLDNINSYNEIRVNSSKPNEVEVPLPESFLALNNDFSQKINGFKEQEKTATAWWKVISFLVVATTGASTLVSTISAARHRQNAVSVKTVIIIAVLTFVASLGNWGVGVFAESRTRAESGALSARELRDKFLKDYFGEPDPGKKDYILTAYRGKLDDL